MPVTPSLTEKGIHLLIEYQKKVDKMIKNFTAQDVPPQYLAARSILQIFIDSASSIIWPFLQNLKANKKKLDSDFQILSQGKKVAIHVINPHTLLLGELTIDLLTKLKNNIPIYIDAGTAFNKLGPLLAPFIGEETKIENTEQAFAFIQYQIITAISEITNEIYNYNNNNNIKNNKFINLISNQLPIKYSLKSPQINLPIEFPKQIPDESIKSDKFYRPIDKEYFLGDDKKNKASQIANLMVLLDQIHQPYFFQNWPLAIPENLLQIISCPKTWYMAVTFEQKYRLIKSIITNIFLCSHLRHKKQIEKKIKNLPEDIKNKLFKYNIKFKLPEITLSKLTYEIRKRYIILLKKNPGIFPLRFAIDGLLNALNNCQYQNQLEDIIESVSLLQKNLQNPHLDSQMIFKALCYEMKFSLKKSAITFEELLKIPDSERIHTITCLNTLLNHSKNQDNTERVYHLALCALNNINGHLKNKIISIVEDKKINNLNFSSFDIMINNQIILLLQYILNLEKNFFFLYSPTKPPYYLVDYASHLAKKLFECKSPENLTKIHDEIDNMKTVLIVNDHSYSDLKSLLKKIQKTFYIYSENITAVPIKKC